MRRDLVVWSLRDTESTFHKLRWIKVEKNPPLKRWSQKRSDCKLSNKYIFLFTDFFHNFYKVMKYFFILKRAFGACPGHPTDDCFVTMYAADIIHISNGRSLLRRVLLHFFKSGYNEQDCMYQRYEIVFRRLI